MYKAYDNVEFSRDYIQKLTVSISSNILQQIKKQFYSANYPLPCYHHNQCREDFYQFL